MSCSVLFSLFLLSVCALPTLHMIALFHTIPSLRFSHCAFTGKVLRFPKMMRLYDWRVVEYHNGESESEANEHVQLLTTEEFDLARTIRNSTHFIGHDAVIGGALHKLFESRLMVELEKRLQPGDIVLHPFSWSHKVVSERFTNVTHVESGIGYPDTFLGFRIFESWAWYHYQHGVAKNAVGSTYNWVIPNYYDESEWPESALREDMPIVFMGRIVTSKGVDIVRELAVRFPNRLFLIAGQGDPCQFFSSELANVRYVGPLEGKHRATFVCTAAAMLMPSSMIEPFGGSAVEAQMCGTPVISTNFGAFTETIEHGVSGYRCATLGDYLAAINAVERLNRTEIALRARRLYSLHAVGKLYDAAFRMINDVRNGHGWYSEQSYTISPTVCAQDLCSS
jgi:glycosyltransferase involved in cell wall biosynthesis